ncbi:MAG: L-alanine exporter AlaE [Candidatus Pacearchaeota archaeon]|jgi:hypothetical protein
MIQTKSLEQKISFMDKFKSEARNWAIDTSAKVLAYAPIMGAMEAYNGLEAGQILKSRAAAALVDGAVARVYTKTADYLSNKFNVDLKNGGIKGWALDTAAMVGVYTPVYAGILKASGADNQQTASALLMGAGIAALTSKPFRKYALMPWRKMWNYKK